MVTTKRKHDPQLDPRPGKIVAKKDILGLLESGYSLWIRQQYCTGVKFPDFEHCTVVIRENE